MAARRRVSVRVRQQLAVEAGHACSYCRAPAFAGVPMAVDHIMPLAAGGGNDLSNLCLKFVLGVSGTGRATVEALQLNALHHQQARTIWILAGIHPPLA